MKTRRQIEKQIKNLLVAQAMMQDIPARHVTKQLSDWRKGDAEDVQELKCGTAACFGGWVALHPYFQKQGIRAEMWSGSPYSYRTPFSGAFDCSEMLFGEPFMFNSREDFEGSPADSDKTIVLQRIKNALKNRLDELDLFV